MKPPGPASWRRSAAMRPRIKERKGLGRLPGVRAHPRNGRRRALDSFDRAKRAVSSTVQGGGTRRGGRSIPLTTGRVMYEMPVVVARQEWHFEPSMCCVLGANEKPNAESADRESPSCGVVAAPMAE